MPPTKRRCWYVIYVAETQNFEIKFNRLCVLVAERNGGHIPCNVVAHYKDVGRASVAVYRFCIDHVEVGGTAFYATQTARQLVDVSIEETRRRHNANVIRFGAEHIERIRR